MPVLTKVAGAWKEADALHVKVGGVWKDVAVGYTKVDGVWEDVYPGGAPPPVNMLILYTASGQYSGIPGATYYSVGVTRFPWGQTTSLGGTGGASTHNAVPFAHSSAWPAGLP